MRVSKTNQSVRMTMAVLLASSAIALAMPAMAQDAEEEATEDGGIIVTANKREQNLQDVPAAVTALGTETLDQLQVNDLQDTVKFLPSVTIQQGAPVSHKCISAVLPQAKMPTTPHHCRLSALISTKCRLRPFRVRLICTPMI